jgi:hypothetical protein
MLEFFFFFFSANSFLVSSSLTTLRNGFDIPVQLGVNNLTIFNSDFNCDLSSRAHI